MVIRSMLMGGFISIVGGNIGLSVNPPLRILRSVDGRVYEYYWNVVNRRGEVLGKGNSSK
ncbi:hypothetical protein Cri9333_3087 [Crinalium epipsammum PCC 9333]|uniref:Uncharacterized protein n=1 Tax=Crinalium epipsammum PCC 9333 TaxID=1173022 RepID=K9W126_9CYAN|nr:hypothetical protein Cri9333_3087 [Crinalium epipsammum PCC 9333]